MKKTISWILLLLPVMSVVQAVNVDSLVNVLNTKDLTNRERMALHHEIYNVYVLYDLEEATGYAKSGLELAEKENSKVMISKFNAAFGRICATKSDYETALEYWTKSLDLAIAAKDKELEAGAYLGMGVAYARQKMPVQAVENFTKALSICESLGDKKKSIVLLGNLGGLYRGMDNVEKSLYYLEKAQKLVEETHDEVGKMQIYFELGAIYSQPRLHNEDKKTIEMALDYELKAYKISSAIQNKAYQAGTCQALALIYSKLEDYDMALMYTNETLKHAEDLGDQMTINGAWHSLSNYYRIQGRYKESEEFALKVWQADSTNATMGVNILQNIVAANIALGNKDKAMQFLRKTTDFITRQIDRNNQEIMADIEAKYETEKKEMRIATLEGERKLYIGLVIAILVAFFSGIGLLVYRHRLATQKRKMVEQQVKQLEQEKTLIAVQSSLKAEKAERDLIAHDLHDSVSSLLTVVKNNMSLYADSEYKENGYFNNAFEVLSKSITELRRVVYHLKSFILTNEGLGAALDDFCRFIPNAEFHFKGLDRRFDPDKEYVLYDCVCELINNALKHSRASRIEVHINIDEQIVYLSVADNGNGFDVQNMTPGIGISNIRSNLSAFGGHLDILSEPDRGTEANIEMEV